MSDQQIPMYQKKELSDHTPLPLKSPRREGPGTVIAIVIFILIVLAFGVLFNHSPGW